MPIQFIRPGFLGEIRDPFDCDEQTVKALAAASAFVALADGHLDAIERDEAVDYIDGRQVAPTVSRSRITEFFDDRARRLVDADFGDLIVDGLRPVAALSLTGDVVRIADRVAAADRHIDSKEAHIMALIRLIMMTFPEPKLLDSYPKSSGN
jgi:hypothetical protein